MAVLVCTMPITLRFLHRYGQHRRPASQLQEFVMDNVSRKNTRSTSIDLSTVVNFAKGLDASRMDLSGGHRQPSCCTTRRADTPFPNEELLQAWAYYRTGAHYPTSPGDQIIPHDAYHKT